MDFDKNNKDFFSNFDKKDDFDDSFGDNFSEDFSTDFNLDNEGSFDEDIDLGSDAFGDDFNLDNEDSSEDVFGDKNSSDDIFGDDFSLDDSEDDVFGDDSKGNSSFGDDFNDFGDDDLGISDGNDDSVKDSKQKGDGVFSIVSGSLDKILGYVGLGEGSALHKIVKYIIYAVFLFILIFVVIGNMLLGSLFGDDTETKTDNGEETFLGSIKNGIGGIFGGEDYGAEGINDVTLEASYEEDYFELAQNNVFRYKQPAVIKGTTFKIFNVETYDELSNATESDYLKVDFGIMNESTYDLKFTEYDFKLYTKDALESKDSEDKGYIGINEENSSVNVDVDGLSEELKGLFVSKGKEPTVIRMGDNSTSIGRGVVKPGEVYNGFVVFEVTPDVEEYVIGFNPKEYPFEMLMKTYE